MATWSGSGAARFATRSRTSPGSTGSNWEANGRTSPTMRESRYTRLSPRCGFHPARYQAPFHRTVAHGWTSRVVGWSSPSAT